MAGHSVWHEQGRPNGARSGIWQAQTHQGRVEADKRTRFLDYSAALGALWRRKFSVAFFCLTVTAGAIAVTSHLPAHYVAHVSIAIGDPLAGGRFFHGDGEGAGFAALPDAPAVQTEIEILRSPRLAVEVIRDLDLQDNPDFDPAATERPNGLSWIGKWLFGSRAALDDPADADARLAQAADNFLGHLRIGYKDNSRMVDVAFDSPNPDLAMQIANAIADRYVGNQLEVRSQSARRTSAWLGDKIADLRLQVETAEKAVERYRAEAGLFTTPGEDPPLLNQIADVATQLTTARTARAEIEARLSQFRDSGRSDGRGIASVGGVDSPLMRTLDMQQADAEQKLAEASASLGGKNPATLGLRERLKRIQAAQRTEVARAAASLKSDLKVAQIRERELGDRLVRLQSDATDMNHAKLQLRVLEREAQADRLVLENFLGRFKEVSERGEISSQMPSARIVSYAQRPVPSDRAHRGLVILIAASASLIGVAFAALLAKQTDSRLHSPQDAENRLGIASLGALHFCRAAQLSPSGATRYGSSYREAAKEVYSRIFRMQGRSIVMVVTSALPAEGKTTLALSLAAMAAQGGQQVLFVDADFRKWETTGAFPLCADAGLAEVLDGRAMPGEAIRTDPASGADVLVSGAFSRASLLASIVKVPDLFASLKDRYDLIIVDTSSVLSAPEAVALAAYADTTVMAIRGASTRSSTVESALKQLHDSGAAVVGSVLTMVDKGQHWKYGFPAPVAPRRRGTAPNQPAITTNTRSAEMPTSGACSRGSTLSRYALLVLDVPETFASRRRLLPADAFDRLIGTINRLSQTASDIGITVVHARRRRRNVVAEAFAPSTMNSLKGDLAAAGSGQRLQIVPEFSFTRSGGDAFSNGALDEALRKNAIGHLFIAGLEGTTSIRQTALSALALGYRVSFIQDGIFSAFESRWKRVLSELESAAAFAVTSGEFTELAMATYKANEVQRRRSEAQKEHHLPKPDAIPASSAVAAIGETPVDRIRPGRLREAAMAVIALVTAGAAGWWCGSEISSRAATRPLTVLATEIRGEAGRSDEHIAIDLRQAFEQERARVEALTHDLETARAEIETRKAIPQATSRESAEATQAAERSAAAARQALEEEQARTAALTRDLDAARAEIEARTTVAGTANAEAAQLRETILRTAHELEQSRQQERERTDALTRELAAARHELEMRHAASTEADEKIAHLQQAAERVATEQRQALQQERDKAEGLARKLVEARGELEAQASAKANDEAARNRQLAELRGALQQAEASAATSQEALAQERARNDQLAQRPAAGLAVAGEQAPMPLVAHDAAIVATADRRTATTPVPLATPEDGTSSETSHLIVRASLLLKQGDVAAARIVLDHVAETDNAQALFALAETYDPLMLSKWGTLGTRGDPAKARELYAKAFAGGVQQAKERFDALRRPEGEIIR